MFAKLKTALAPRSARKGPPSYPGDFEGKFDIEYSPKLDGKPDPGEVVWTWVPFEEDFNHGKDRPVLLIGRDGDWLLGLMLTSKDHNRNTASEAHWGRYWLDIGSGAWDRQGRPSEVRLDRVLRVNPRTVRREGAVLPYAKYEQVSRSLIECHHW
ncbi:type II toxin-antitoxin system PemK/MazF family toxin [Demequina aurantiaca]|uniref:type II toxin-antitoxin system PemK/MazF family toxin n=1 Tax=Demequina aurantiaca TaxID=676200 RepID=UPI000783FBDB|nr:type II toxin-antitoxin system PemK/MazF family toxin [Demequina aurantiaca]